MNCNNLLLHLLRLSLGNDDGSFFGEIDSWEDVMALAERQGVLAITFDGVQKLPREQMPDIDSLMEWLGQTSYNETLYESYEKAICKLTSILEQQELRPIIMKGYGCSLNYPKPNHRPCGDIDIFVLNKAGEHNHKLVSFVVQMMDVDTVDNGHHSVFAFEDFTVENHETVLDVNTHKSSRYLNELLESLISQGVRAVEVEGQKIYLPSVRFNSIHLLRHMANDFATVKTTLRHVLDWSTFISKNEVDWNFVHDVAHKANMNRFLDAVNGICVEYLGYPSEMFPVETEDVKLRDRVLSDIMSPEFTDEIPEMSNKFAYGWVKTKRLIANRWKYRIVYDESLLESFWTLAMNRLKRS